MDEQTYASIFLFAVFLILFVKESFRLVQEETDEDARFSTDDCFGNGLRQ